MYKKILLFIFLITLSTSVAYAKFNPSGGGTYRLQSSIGTTNNTIKLSSFTEPISDIPYTMSYLNSDIECGTLDPQTSKSEFISFTGITQNSDGTALLTGVSRGLSRSYPYTASTTFRQAHSGQSQFILSDSPCLFDQYFIKSNDATSTGTVVFTGNTTFATSTGVKLTVNDIFSNTASMTRATVTDAVFTNATSSTLYSSVLTSLSSIISALTSYVVNFGTMTVTGTSTVASTTFTGTPTWAGTPVNLTDLTTKQYVDGVSIAGSPISTNIVTGIGRMASTSQITSGYSSTTPYFIPSSLASSTASTGPVVVVSGASGVIDSSFFGNVNISGSSNIASSSIKVYAATSTAHNSTSTWTKPANLKYVEVTTIGGGGGGSFSGTCQSGSYYTLGTGGSAAGYSQKIIPASLLGSTETIISGKAGLRGSSTASALDGGYSSFGSFASSTGGGGVNSGEAPDLGGSGFGGDINITGLTGIFGLPENNELSTYHIPAPATFGGMTYGFGGYGGLCANGGSENGQTGGYGVVILREYYY